MRLVAMMVLLAACGAEPGAGQVVVALTTTDPSDGTVYRLTRGTRLEVSSWDYFDRFSLDGDGPLVSINVPPGNYTVTLEHDGDVWELERTRPEGAVDTVNAELATPMPVMLYVPDGFSASLILEFTLASGTITFGKGTIDVSEQVSVVTARGAKLEATATLLTGAAQVGTDAPAAIVERLPAVGDTESLWIGGRINGPWTPRSSTTVCAPLEAEMSSPPSGFADLVVESFAFAHICVRGGAEEPAVVLSFSRNDAPITPTFAGLGGLHTFQTVLDAALPVPVYDGTTLDLEALNHTFVGLDTIAITLVDDWYVASYRGPIEFTFIPTAN